MDDYDASIRPEALFGLSSVGIRDIIRDTELALAITKRTPVVSPRTGRTAFIRVPLTAQQADQGRRLLAALRRELDRRHDAGESR